MSRSRWSLLVSLVLAVACAVPMVPALAAGQDTSLGQLSLSGKQVRIYNVAGRLDVTPTTGTSVLVKFTLGGKDGSQITPKVWNSGATILAMQYPGNRVVYPSMGQWSNSSFSYGKDGTFGDDKKSGWFGSHKMTVAGGGGGLEAWADLSVGLPKGQDVLIRLGVGEVRLRNVDGDIYVDTGAGDVLAETVHGRLRVETGSGAISASDCNGMLSFDTGSGDVRTTNLKGDTILADTGSGRVSMTGIQATRLSADTGSGDVALSNVTCPRIHVDTGSGSVRVRVNAPFDQIDVDTGSGDVALEAPSTLDATLYFDSGSGDVRTDFPLTIVSKDEDSLTARIGNGKSRIAVDTGSGDLRLIRL